MTIRFGSGPPSMSSVAAAGQEAAAILRNRGGDRRPIRLHRGRMQSRKTRLQSPFQPLVTASSAAPAKLAFRYAHRPSFQKGFALPRRSEIDRVTAAFQFSKSAFDLAEPSIAE